MVILEWIMCGLGGRNRCSPFRRFSVAFGAVNPLAMVVLACGQNEISEQKLARFGGGQGPNALEIFTPIPPYRRHARRRTGRQSKATVFADGQAAFDRFKLG